MEESEVTSVNIVSSQLSQESDNNIVKTSVSFLDPVFYRSDLAKILNCTPLTISNREKKKKYPEPTRNSGNGYRTYSLLDVFILQNITYGKVYLASILSILYDMGYKDPVTLEAYINETLVKFRSQFPASSPENGVS